MPRGWDEECFEHAACAEQALLWELVLLLNDGTAPAAAVRAVVDGWPDLPSAL